MIKIIWVNKKDYDEIVKQLGYVPDNLKINNFLPGDGKAYMVDMDEMNKMLKPKGLLKKGGK